jgi:phosphoglycerol transferase MdoB-like AlkP superfamily enzyme
MAKPVFMWYNSVNHPFTAGDVAQVILHGLTLDLSMSLYLLIIPFLCVVISIFTGSARWLRIILKTYYAIIAVAVILALLADASLYEFWLFKLESSCLQYLETPTEAMASVSTGYLLVRLVVWIVLSALLWLAYTRPRWDIKPSRYRIIASLIALMCIPLIIIGIRGGLDESTTNIGQVYYSQNQFLNHSAVNPVFSFFASFEESASVNTVYEFMDDKTCDSIINKLYNTESKDCDTLLTTQTPNIIIILLEGCGGEFTEIGGREDVTPNMNRLAKEGIYFTNCYANSWRTDRGTVCTYSGYPSFPTMSVMKMPAKTRNLPCIAKTLRDERGYSTHYLYGGDINFTKMRSYLVAGGFENLKWKADYEASEQSSAKWGVRDDITFETLYQMSTSLKSPYLIGYSTLSSHEPWDVPIHHFDDEVLNAFYYLDQCIGNYVARLKKSPVWKNTLVILLPDHGIRHKEIDDLHPLKNHIPMIWIGGAVKEPRRIEAICNQTDLPATLLAQLMLNHDAYTFSRDVLSKSYKYPLAINTVTEGFSTVDSTGFTFYDLNSHKKVKGSGDINIGKAILQAASRDLDKR